jgi:hypothetical protein
MRFWCSDIKEVTYVRYTHEHFNPDNLLNTLFTTLLQKKVWLIYTTTGVSL